MRNQTHKQTNIQTIKLPNTHILRHTHTHSIFNSRYSWYSWLTFEGITFVNTATHTKSATHKHILMNYICTRWSCHVSNLIDFRIKNHKREWTPDFSYVKQQKFDHKLWIKNFILEWNMITTEKAAPLINDLPMISLYTQVVLVQITQIPGSGFW